MKVSPTKEFDENTHVYKIDGRQVPSVTQVIKNLFPFYEKKMADWYMQRGSAVHLAIHLMTDNRLEWGSVDPRILGYLHAFQKFCVETNYLPSLSEIRMYDGIIQFAGTADILLVDNEGRLILADIKSTITPVVNIQLGGYSCLWHKNFKRKLFQLCAIELDNSGGYKIKWVENIKTAERLFLSCLQIYNFKQLNNL